MDRQIRELRKLTRKAKTVDETYHYFEELNKLQRQRFAQKGSFLPCADGFIYSYMESEDMWLRFDSETAFK